VYTIKSKRKIQSLLKTVWEKTRKYKYFAFENEHYLQSKKKVVYKHVKYGYDADILANFKSATTRSYL
jgi:hypothetical protein